MWNLQSTFYDIIIALQFLIKYVRTASDFCCQTSLHCNLVVTVGAQYIDETVRPLLLFSLGTVDSYLAGLDWNRPVQPALPSRPMHQLKPVQQSRKQVLGAYCPNIYWELVLSNTYFKRGFTPNFNGVFEFLRWRPIDFFTFQIR